jgi:hypothetical protein
MFCGMGNSEMIRFARLSQRGDASSVQQGEAIMAAGVPAWGEWTTFYDSAGQVPTMIRNDSEDGLVASFGMDRLELNVQGGPDAPFAGAMGLSGSLSVNMPDEYPLVGFLLIVRGQLIKSLGSGAAVSWSIGHATKSVEWPLGGASGLAAPDPDAEDASFPQGSFLETGFNVTCFLDDTRPGAVGQPPYPQLPPLPITISAQARRRFVDESVILSIIEFEVLIVR